MDSRASLSTVVVRTSIVVVAAAACIVYAAPPWLTGLRPKPAIEVFDVGERAARLAAEQPEGKSLVDGYSYEETGSAHLHILGKSVVCQLHLHEHTYEATIPVMGRPIVRQMFADGASVRTVKREYAEGALIASPPYCAHEWTNPRAEGDHASLVFTMGASFPGNLFVGEDDPRIVRSGPAVVFDTETELARFAESTERLRVEKLAISPGEVSAVLLKDSYVLPAGEGSPTFVYASAGGGTLQGPEPAIALHPKVLVIVRLRRALTLVASREAPLAVFVVRFPS
jgi:hypothetical protein